MFSPNSLHKDKYKYTDVYRGRVVEVDVEDEGEKNKYGAVRVFIPDLMNKEIDKDLDEFKNGILAYPANMLMGGYNEDDKEGSANFAAAGIFVPNKNSYVRIVFEGGDLERAFYLGPWHDKIAPLPIVNRNVEQPHKVYTVVISGEGRSFVVCDSPDQARIEMTGKKRKLTDKEGPSGNKSSLYTVDGNQSIILIDERDGSEKILIKTYKGDFLNIDIEKQTLECSFKGDIMMKTGGNFQVSAAGDIDLKANGSASLTAVGTANLKSTLGGAFIEGRMAAGLKSTGLIMIKGAVSFVQSALSCPAKAAAAAQPQGERGESGGDTSTDGFLSPGDSLPSVSDTFETTD
jgi:hypothetical protein